MSELSRQREQALGEGEAERLGYLTHELRNVHNLPGKGCIFSIELQVATT